MIFSFVCTDLSNSFSWTLKWNPAEFTTEWKWMTNIEHVCSRYALFIACTMIFVHPQHDRWINMPPKLWLTKLWMADDKRTLKPPEKHHSKFRQHKLWILVLDAVWAIALVVFFSFSLNLHTPNKLTFAFHFAVNVVDTWARKKKCHSNVPFAPASFLIFRYMHDEVVLNQTTTKWIQYDVDLFSRGKKRQKKNAVIWFDVFNFLLLMRTTTKMSLHTRLTHRLKTLAETAMEMLCFFQRVSCLKSRIFIVSWSNDDYLEMEHILIELTSQFTLANRKPNENWLQANMLSCWRGGREREREETFCITTMSSSIYSIVRIYFLIFLYVRKVVWLWFFGMPIKRWETCAHTPAETW